MKKFHHVGLGGTFDRLHSGHKSLIDLAFAIAHRVSLGIARKICSKDKFLSANIESYVIRQREVEDYLKSKKLLDRALFFPLDNIFGSAGQDKTVEAIIVSKETHPNALKINQLRKQKNLPLLKIIVAPYVLGDDGKIITSGRIRGGEIDRAGRSYFKVFVGKNKLILPFNLRSQLRRPIGQVIVGKENQLEETAEKTLQLINILKSTLVISVGDVITGSLLKIGFDPEIKIIDFKVRRKRRKESPFIRSVLIQGQILNKPGTINFQAVEIFQKALKKYFRSGQKQLIIINGEEDLVTLPAVLLAPLGSIVLYGQMDLGIVAVSVTEEKKKEGLAILKRFI